MKNTDACQQKNATSSKGYTLADCWQRSDLQHAIQDKVAEEVPVALVYNGISHVVMMASPKDLEAFALGFSLSEGIIESLRDILGVDIVHHKSGTEVQIELSSRRFMQLKARRRNLTGRTGCGVCGVEQLNDIGRPLPALPFTQRFPLAALEDALGKMRQYQPVGELTGCTHAALWLDNSGTILGGCEDIGRHVALDKMLGLRARQQWMQGAMLVSSRASYEMVQKSAMCGVEILLAVSATTALAIDVAQRSNLTLVGFSRGGRATVYTHPQRLC